MNYVSKSIDTKNLFIKAFNQYIGEHFLFTEYETSLGWNNEEAHFGVFEMPPGYVAFSDGKMHCDPEYRVKPVLIARIGHDGRVIVEETEYTNKYMKSRNLVAV